MAIPEGDEYTVSIQKEFTLYGLRLRSTFTNLLCGVIDTVRVNSKSLPKAEQVSTLTDGRRRAPLRACRAVYYPLRAGSSLQGLWSASVRRWSE